MLDALETRKMSVQELSRRSGVSSDAIYKLKRREGSTTSAENAVAIAAALGIGPETPPQSVAVPGRAGAGAEVQLVDDYTKGDGLFHVECPPQLSPRGIVAVEVEGNSMEPAYTEGDLLFYSRDAMGVPTEAIGRMCIAADEDGRVWVKQVKAGTEAGLFNLLSINPMGANMHDVRLKWAAPVKLHLPREFVRKI